MSHSTSATTTQSTARAARQFGEMGKWAPYYDLVMGKQQRHDWRGTRLLPRSKTIGSCMAEVRPWGDASY